MIEVIAIVSLPIALIGLAVVWWKLCMAIIDGEFDRKELL